MRPLLPFLAAALLACGGTSAPDAPSGRSDGPGRRAPEDTLADGHHIYRDAQGRPTAEGDIRDRKRHGVWTSYNEQGRVRSRNEYVHGVLHGPTVTFRDNGALYYIGQHRNGVQVGEWKFHDGTGSLIRTVRFDSTGREVPAP